MKVSDFDFELPNELIARYPLTQRTQSRLLLVDSGLDSIIHSTFENLLSILKPNDLLVLNDTRVMPARLYGVKSTGGQLELLIERLVDDHQAWVHIKANKSIKIGAIFYIENNVAVLVVERKDNLFLLSFQTNQPVFELLKKYGHIPLPPYMKRQDELSDRERYQTVYAKKEGAIAAPTAGLHFDSAMLERIKHQGVEIAYVTLHVGSGTFQPVKVNSILEHDMHAEYMEVSQQVCDQVNAARDQGGRIVAVGTTSVRCLETASTQGSIAPYSGETKLFIYPGYHFQSTDLLLTNFHLPKSTLLMLVSAFSGSNIIKKAYESAVLEKYRFFSYGDAMLLSRHPTSINTS